MNEAGRELARRLAGAPAGTSSTVTGSYNGKTLTATGTTDGNGNITLTVTWDALRNTKLGTYPAGSLLFQSH